MSWVVAIALVVRAGAALTQADPEGVPPPALEAPAPVGPAPTRATFLSTSSEQWDVVVDGQPMCSTPCSGPLFPVQFVVLRSQEDDPLLVEVGRLPPGDLVVSGKPLQPGMYAGGIVATTFGGMAVAVGITLSAVGLAKDRGGMTTAGLITGGAGVITLTGGIYLMLKAVPSVSVDRAAPAAVGPAAGVGGTF